jgi:hypothetical protein
MWGLACWHQRIESIMCESYAYRSLIRVLGLAWTVFLGTATTTGAQTRSESPSPPVRLPGIMYPGMLRRNQLIQSSSQPASAPDPALWKVAARHRTPEIAPLIEAAFREELSLKASQRGDLLRSGPWRPARA